MGIDQRTGSPAEIRALRRGRVRQPLREFAIPGQFTSQRRLGEDADSLHVVIELRASQRGDDRRDLAQRSIDSFLGMEDINLELHLLMNRRRIDQQVCGIQGSTQPALGRV